jgi:site-specific recombinase XerD
MYKKTQIKSTSKSHKKYILDDNSINKFKTILINEEKKPQTIKKYMRDIIKLKEYAAGRPVNKELLITYKEHLKKDCGYKTTSINSFLAVINTFVTEMGWNNLKIKMIKVQKETKQSMDWCKLNNSWENKNWKRCFNSSKFFCKL